ncbi:MAG: glycosyltransferase family 87 protein, partial [Anaerolineae bacterium]
MTASWGLAGQSLLWLQQAAPGKMGWDFQIYLNAAGQSAQGQNPYQPFQIGSGFLNHPFLLSLVTPLAKLPPKWGTAVWLGAAFLAWMAAIGSAFLLAAEKHSISRWRAVFAAALFMGTAPLFEALYVGQVSPFVALLLVLCMLLTESGRPVLAGVSLTLAIVGKTSPLLLLAYFAVVGQWRVVGSSLITLLLLTGLTAVQFSPDLPRQFLAF